MAGEDRWVTLDRAADFVSGGTPSKANSAYWGGSIPWVSAKDMKSFLIEDTEDHITQQGLDNGAQLAPAGATLVLIRGMTLLNDVPICVSKKDVAFNQDIKALIPHDGVVGRYLSYAVLAKKPELLSAVDLAGHGTGRLPTDLFKSLRIRLPVDNEQRAIVHILGTLDDKIELNRRMNETLEAIARAIFNSWFVDFDPVRAKASGEPFESIWRRLGLTPDVLTLFPDRFQESELGEIPEGWEVCSVGDLADVTSGKRPDDRRERWSAEYQVPLWGGNGPMGFVSSALYSKPIILTGRVGTLGSVFRISSPCWPSDNTLIVIPKNPLGYEFLFFRLIEIDFRSLNRGSTQPLLSQSDLKVQRYVLPSVKLLESFHVSVRDIFAFIEAMNRESTRLADLRDTVLPKLLSGELPVPVVSDA